jgi:hypothetical protein
MAKTTCLLCGYDIKTSPKWNPKATGQYRQHILQELRTNHLEEEHHINVIEGTISRLFISEGDITEFDEYLWKRYRELKIDMERQDNRDELLKILGVKS